MPAVVTFWRFPEEEESFVDFLTSVGGVAVPFERVAERSAIGPEPLAEYLERTDPNDVLITLPEHARAVRLVEFTEHGRTMFVADHVRSPVIAYTRGKWRDSELGGSNLAAYWSFVDENDRTVDRPAEFVAWAKKVYRWVRAATPFKLSRGWRATPAVAEAVKKGLKIAT